MAVAALVNGLTPALKEKLADALTHWHGATQVSEPVSPTQPAPVHIEAWVDVDCLGSSEVVATLARLKVRYPREFDYVLRSFPRGVVCDEGNVTSNVRCLAAATRVCVQGASDAEAIDHALFSERRMSPERIASAAGTDAACRVRESTIEELQRTVARGTRRGVKETPFVVVNGRHASRFAPFLELLILTRGVGRHPALAALPAAH